MVFEIKRAAARIRIDNQASSSRYSNDIESGPKKKSYFFGLQDEASADNEASADSDIEIEPSREVTIIRVCGDTANEIELLDELYKVCAGNGVYSSPLTKIKSHLQNTMLHIAAWYGNDKIVSLVVEHAPTLLFEFNSNNDTALHIAARSGHVYIVEKLLANYANIERRDIKMAWLKYTNNKDDPEFYNEEANMWHLLNFVKWENGQGNTMFHEAMLCGDIKRIGGDKIFKVCELYTAKDHDGNSLSKCCYEYALDIINHAKKSVLYRAVENGDKDAVKLIMENYPNNNEAKPKGLSPVVAAIMKRNQEVLSIILEKKPSWIHLEDTHERLPLHYASSIGYLEGVHRLIGICKCCIHQRDKYGYFPIHLASHRGHLKVVQKLLEYCPDPSEIRDHSHQRNILHVAAKSGKHEVVCYILLLSHRILELGKMINQKDYKGNTPLLLAAKSCHPKTVFYLTWDERVDLHVVNKNNQTALELVTASQLLNPSARKQLTLVALNSAGANLSFRRSVDDKSRQSDSNSQTLGQSSNKFSDTEQHKGQSDSRLNENNKEVSDNTAQYFFLTGSKTQYKNMVQTLTLVSTLIITASVAACFAVPGEADGKANNLCHTMFQAFIIFITISLFSSSSATIILFWATLGLNELAAFSLKIVMPILGIALISLSLAFMAGIYTVISELTWLANLFMLVTPIFVVVVFLLYIILFLPSSSTRKSLRYISYFPFLFLAWLTE